MIVSVIGVGVVDIVVGHRAVPQWRHGRALGDASDGAGVPVGRDPDRRGLEAGSVDRRQRRAAGQGQRGIVGDVHRKGGGGRKSRFQCGDVDTGTDHEHRLRRVGQTFQAGHHVLHLDHRVGGVQASAVDPDHRAVGDAHDRQRGGIAFEEHQRGVLTTEGLPDRLGQCARRVQFGDQDDVINVVRPQGFLQLSGCGVVGPCHPGGDDAMSTPDGTVPGAEDPPDHLFSGSSGGEVDAVLVDGGAVGVRTFDQHHTNSRGCHRHTEYDVHVPLRWLNRCTVHRRGRGQRYSRAIRRCG